MTSFAVHMFISGCERASFVQKTFFFRDQIKLQFLVLIFAVFVKIV